MSFRNHLAFGSGIVVGSVLASGLAVTIALFPVTALGLLGAVAMASVLTASPEALILLLFPLVLPIGLGVGVTYLLGDKHLKEELLQSKLLRFFINRTSKKQLAKQTKTQDHMSRHRAIDKKCINSRQSQAQVQHNNIEQTSFVSTKNDIGVNTLHKAYTKPLHCPPVSYQRGSQDKSDKIRGKINNGK